MADHADVGYLSHKRSFLRKQVTEIHNEVSTSLAEFDRNKILKFLKKLEKLSTSLAEFDEQINASLWDKSKSLKENESIQNKVLKDCEAYNDKLSNTVVNLEEFLKSMEVGNFSMSVDGELSNPIPIQRLKPRTTPLPKYSGKLSENLEKFFYNFEGALRNANYSEYEKFILLKDSLQDRASVLIGSLEQSKQSYTEAKLLLEQAFASKEVQISETLNRLVNLKLKTYDDPMMFVSEWRMVRESISSLSIDINVVMQHFLWNSFDKSLRDIFIQMTNQNFPKLDNLEKDLFKAIERYRVFFGEKKEQKS